MVEMAPSTATAGATTGKMITRSKRGMEHHPSSSHLSNSSTASTSNRKPSVAAVAALSLPAVELSSSLRSTAATKLMPPPSGIPPPRTVTKTSRSAVLTAPRPTKKLAKEAMTPLPGVSINSRGGGGGGGGQSSVLRTPLGASRGNSISPPNMSPTHFDRGSTLRMAMPKGVKKLELQPPTKSRMTTAGTTQRRLREPASRPSRADNAPPKTLHSHSGSGSQSRSKGPSKSGVETSALNFAPEVSQSEAGSRSISPTNSTHTNSTHTNSAHANSTHNLLPENIPPHPSLPPVPPVPSLGDLRCLEYQAEVEELKARLTDLTSQLEESGRGRDVVVEEKLRLQGAYEEEKLRLQGAYEEEKLRHADTLQQLQTFSQNNQQLKEDVEMLSEMKERREEECRLKDEEILRLKDEMKEITAQLNALQMEMAALLSAQTATQARTAELELVANKAKEELETTKKEMATLKKKQENEKTRAVEQLAELQKQLLAKEQEAESWRTVTELKQQDVKRLQSDMEVAKGMMERHSLCEHELSAQMMKIEDMQAALENIATAEKKLRTAVKERDDELRDLRRRSMILIQEKDTLKYQLDCSMQLDSVLELDDLNDVSHNSEIVLDPNTS